ncbi:non-specific lipid-transfer protein 1-like [Phalaenopsis equestris]|uniref:non-specific lipid-transfer protein 1-like n=1 Tax=Phalaenopsis equestris TaxID=78828 RepID=UPI0009E443F7|nr:non-specific lipid-transfer protein 1-like [Phalaenopsis equestris]
MARSTASMAVVCILSFLLVSGVFREASGAISCGQVFSSVGSCVSYIRGLGPLTGGCCGGVKKLNGLASTTPDRQAACSCLKSLAGRIPNLKPALAAGLPGKCGVSVPYPISTSTDCSKVH